jgi:hypothetical protein
MLTDILFIGGVIFWFVVFCVFATFIIVTILEKRQQRGSESDG